MAHWPPKRHRKPDLSWSFRGDRDSGKRFEYTLERRRGAEFTAPGFNSELMHKFDRFTVPLTPASTLPLIGAVALHWGALETRMDKLLGAFVTADADPDDHRWERRSFKKRKELLKEKAARRFPGAISDEINQILESAAVYHWQRNLVIHGHFTLHFDKGAVWITASGDVNGRRVEMVVNDTHLERMYHEISFLTGRLQDLIAEQDGDPCRISSQDKSTLRAFAEKYQSNLPKPRKLAPRHPPSRALRHPLAKGPKRRP